LDNAVEDKFQVNIPETFHESLAAGLSLPVLYTLFC
jgi:hypothetical protein